MNLPTILVWRLLLAAFVYTIVRLFSSLDHPYGWIDVAVDIVGVAILVAFNFYLHHLLLFEKSISSELAEIERMAKDIKQKEPNNIAISTFQVDKWLHLRTRSYIFQMLSDAEQNNFEPPNRTDRAIWLDYQIFKETFKK